MNLGLKGKSVVVTGASRGIGRSIALAFADEGANLAICARGAAALAEAAEEIAGHDVQVHSEVCDVEDADALKRFLESSRAALGGVDVLINNASGFGGADDEESWKLGWSVDVMAAVRATWQVAPWMEESGGGSIVHIASTSGLEAGSPPGYAAAKAAMISHSKTMAAVLAPKGIRVNCVAPGSIDFPGGIWDQIRQQNRDHYESILATIPFGRLGRPQEVAAAVVFLSSAPASWIAGATLAVDGVQHKGNL